MGIRLNGQTTGYVQIEAPATAADNTLKLPNGNGSNGQMLTTDGNGNLSFTTPASTDLINDPTPQLGGDLNVDGNSIVSANNGDIVIDPNGTGKVSIDGNITSSATSIQVEKDLNFGSTKRVVGLADPASAQDAATKSYVDTNANLAADSSPQLGGNLDVNGHDIVTVSNGDIDLDPNGSGQVVFKGNATRGSGAVKLNCENNSHGILVKGPPHSAGANYTLTLPNNTGTSGQLLSTNGSGVTSWTTVNAAPSFTATASGAISNGDAVVVNSDGTVSVGGTVITERSSYSAGSEQTLNFASVSYLSGVLDESQNKIVVAYQKASDGKGFVFVVTPNTSGGYATAANTEFESGIVSFNKIVYDSNAQKCVVFYRDAADSDNGKARVIQLNANNTFTVGSATTFDTGAALDIDAVFDPDTNKIVVAYRDSSPNPDDLKAIVGTVSGTSISFGTATTIGDGEKCGITYDTVNNKVVVAYKDQSDSKGKAVVGTVSGTSISFGTAVDFETDQIGQCKCAFHAAEGKVAIYYMNMVDSTRAHLIAGTVSGTSISFGTDVRVDDNNDQGHTDLFYHSGTKRLLACRTVEDDNQAKLFAFSLSGTTLTATKNIEYRGADAKSQTIVDYPDSERLHIFYNNNDSNLQVNPIEVATYATNVTTDNYCGIADANYADGATATIQTVGAIDDAQSGLTPGETYFVQDDGSLGTSAGGAGSRAIAGLALTATNLLIYKA